MKQIITKYQAMKMYPTKIRQFDDGTYLGVSFSWLLPLEKYNDLILIAESEEKGYKQGGYPFICFIPGKFDALFCYK